jgi:hypothetical protein
MKTMKVVEKPIAHFKVPPSRQEKTWYPTMDNSTYLGSDMTIFGGKTGKWSLDRQIKRLEDNSEIDLREICSDTAKRIT